MLSRNLVVLFGLAIAASTCADAQSSEELLPAGPAKDKLVKVCVGCHEMDLVVARRHTRAEWEGVMEDMVARGSSGTPEELKALVDYLNQNLGKVNVNEATSQELEKALKITEAHARSTVAWRARAGPRS